MVRNARRALMFGVVAALAAVVLVRPPAPSLAAHPAHTVARPPHGGTIQIAWSDDMVTFDPAQAINIDWQIMNGTLYNGLYQFDRNGRPQLDLAAAPPTISTDRRTWTFHLRPNVRFQDGTPLTAEDVKFTLTRTLDPHLKPAVSWGQTTDDIFAGSHAYVLGKATSVSGIQVLNRSTIRFVLAKPVAVFPSILAETFNMIVPRHVLLHESADAFGNHPIGTGPFRLQSWQKGTKLVFVRNPYYFHAGKPYLDKIVAYVNVPSNVIALKVEKGELAGFGIDTDLAAADLQQAQTDPQYHAYLVPAPSTYSVWLLADVHVAPLTSLAVRQAIALAINRRHLVALLGGDAVPSNQLYIPLMPQYDPALNQHPLYPYNPGKAAALLKASGYHGQPVTLLYANNLHFFASMAPGILQNLQQIGLNATLRGASNNSISALSASLTGHQLSLTFWSPDYPDGDDTYAGVLACGPNAAGGTTGAHYCDPTADALVSRAQALPLGGQRNALLRQAQVRMIRSAAHIPLVDLKQVEMISPRVGGFYYQPMFGWQFENYWLKPS